MGAIAFLAVAAVSAVVANQNKQKANRAIARGNAEANKANQAATDINNREQKRLAERRKNIRLSQLKAASAASGVTESSSYLGASQSFQTNFAQNYFTNQAIAGAQQEGQRVSQQAADTAGRYQQNASDWTTIGQVAGAAGSMAGKGA